MQQKTEFSKHIKSNDSLLEASIDFSCNESKSNCITKNYEIPESFTHSWSQLFYDGDDSYVSLLKANDITRLTHGEWCIFKNKTEQFCTTMNAGASGPILEMLKQADGILVRYLISDSEGETQIEEKLI